MAFSQSGQSVESVMASLTEKRANDVRWQDGRAFGMVYDGGPGVHEVAERAARALPPRERAEHQGLPVARRRSNPRSSAGPPTCSTAPDIASGFLTSGGTESILCGVKAARERGRIERGITEPEMIVAESAHAAFHKAAHLFGLKLHKTPVLDDWTADVDAMAATGQREHRADRRLGPAVSPGRRSTTSRPSPPWPPTPDANCHVDACMGGFVLPFAERLGRDVPPWDFRVDGRHHDLGRHPQARLRPEGRVGDPAPQQGAAQLPDVLFDDWLGGFYASPNLQGTRSGLPMAAAWAVMQHLGIDGYLDLTRHTLDNADRMRAGIAEIDGVRVLGDGQFHLVAMSSDPSGLRSRRHVRSRRRPGAPRLVPRSPGSARLAALDGVELEHRRDRRLPERLAGMRRRGSRHQHRRPLHQLRHAGVAAPQLGLITRPTR